MLDVAVGEAYHQGFAAGKGVVVQVEAIGALHLECPLYGVVLCLEEPKGEGKAQYYEQQSYKPRTTEGHGVAKYCCYVFAQTNTDMHL